MPGSFPIGSIGGIRIEVNYGWIIIFVLFAASLATGWFPSTVPGLGAGTYWAMGVVAAILLFASVIAHELAHSLVARSRGLPVKSITLFIFGGVSNLEQEPRRPGDEFLLTVVGPLTSIVIGAIAWPIGLAIGTNSRVVAGVLIYLGVANVLLGVFNLIPGFPLDGGRVLRSIIWAATGDLRKATLWSARVGQFVAYLFILWGIWLFFTGNVLGGLWLGFIGWFLLSASQAAAVEQAVRTLFRDTTVAEAMRPVVVEVPPDITLEALFDSYLMPYGLRAVPVVDDGRFVGLVTLAGMRHIPRDRWPATTAREVMIPLERLHAVQPQQRLTDVLPLMARQDVNQLPVIQDGRLVGIVARDSIVRYLEFRRGLSPDEAERRVDQSLPPRAA
jgi:Zn-dependent protease/predicted transcriptional regulator